MGATTEANIRTTHKQIQAYRKPATLEIVEELFKFVEESGLKGTRREFFLAQVFADTNGLVDNINKKNPREFLDSSLAKWNKLNLNKYADYLNFGEVVGKYTGSRRDLDNRLSWLSRVQIFIYLLKA